MNSLSGLVLELVEICSEASEKIMHIYREPHRFDIQQKQDSSPVTAADMASNEIILDGLKRLTPDIPIISEERCLPWGQRQDWSQYWLVDPLDGTKEFIARNDEFCIAIALMKGSEPVLGLIYEPVTDDFFWGSAEMGAFHQHQAIRCQPASSPIHAIGSRRFKGEGHWREKLENEGFEVERVAQGSALKFCRIANGEADLYPRMGPTCEWDTAAGQAILEGAGGCLVDEQGKPFRYNKKNLLNPHFYAMGDPSLMPLLIDF